MTYTALNTSLLHSLMQNSLSGKQNCCPLSNTCTVNDVHCTQHIDFSFSDAEQSFRKAKWLPQARILQLKPQLLRNFIQRRHDDGIDEFGDLVNGIHPDSLLVERVIAQKSTLHGQLYLTKWRGLAYTEATWETEEDLKDDKVGCWCSCYKALTDSFRGRYLHMC